MPLNLEDFKNKFWKIKDKSINERMGIDNNISQNFIDLIESKVSRGELIEARIKIADFIDSDVLVMQYKSLKELIFYTGVRFRDYSGILVKLDRDLWTELVSMDHRNPEDAQTLFDKLEANI